MLSKNKIKLINSLDHKKYRETNKLFVAEGEKILREVLSSGYSVKILVINDTLLQSLPEELLEKPEEIITAKDSELSKISFLSSSSKGLAVIEIQDKAVEEKKITGQLSLVIEQLQDPGNFGTIIRTADWFGIRNIFCSHDCVDQYNSKVIQSTMGSFIRVNIQYCDLPKLLEKYSSEDNFPIYGSFLYGKNIYQEPLRQNGFIVIGNESKGISEQLSQLINHRISIPYYPANEKTIDSLNASLACAIICSEFRRRTLKT